MSTFQKVLIANRGEIAVRISRTLREMGIGTVAVYSDADRHALHVRAADEAYPLEGTSATETYLRADKIVGIAKRVGADAIHPGYGFLSENQYFADACGAAGITFIGPRPDVIRAMGDKVEARQLARNADVPIVPGWSGNFDVGIRQLRAEAEKIGFPILVKAAAGGGGKGMRVVREPGDLEAALESAGREAKSAFGDARVFFEKFIEKPRHVEIQIFGDTHGNVVHLFERECSIQRRHQKIVEESPSPAVTPEIRAEMGAAAVRLAREIGYTNAGTVEFMLDAAGKFYFLEVNARLQVEHPVTELVTMRDLVRLQLQVAAGEELAFTQDELKQHGHALECRIYAEDAARGFLPSTGRIAYYDAPMGPGVRVDSGVVGGSEVSIHYDPMLAKLVVWGETRDSAVARMIQSLRRFVVLGVTTNIEFLQELLKHPRFVSGDVHTQFLDEETIAVPEDVPDEVLLAAAAVTGNGRSRRLPGGDGVVERSSPWRQGGGWRALA